MARALKLTVWIVVLAVCAGVGAFIASRSNPFPPGVGDPGARPTPATGPQVDVARWTGASVVRTTHRLLVGGSCRTNWRLRWSVREEVNRVTGRASATLLGEPRCDFPTAQVQTRRISFELRVRVLSSSWRIGFSEHARAPAGSIDLGALVPLLERLRLELAVAGDLATGGLIRTMPDGERGTYSISGAVELVRRP